jgi:hypothetical protein
LKKEKLTDKDLQRLNTQTKNVSSDSTSYNLDSKIQLSIADSEHENDQFNELNKDRDIAEVDKYSAYEKTRVVVSAIEFDWLLNTNTGARFLENLADTDDMSYYDIDIVKHIVNYQWTYYLPRIGLYIFLPFFIFFVLFLVYATYVVDKMNRERDSEGNWMKTALISGVILGLYQVFFIVIEIRQILHQGKRYFKFFWNYVDLVSIILNYLLIFLVILGGTSDFINSIAAACVLLLWVRGFYLLRIFTETAYLISMIIAIVIDMRFFLLSLVVAIVAF